MFVKFISNDFREDKSIKLLGIGIIDQFYFLYTCLLRLGVKIAMPFYSHLNDYFHSIGSLRVYEQAQGSLYLSIEYKSSSLKRISEEAVFLVLSYNILARLFSHFWEPKEYQSFLLHECWSLLPLLNRPKKGNVKLTKKKKVTTAEEVGVLGISVTYKNLFNANSILGCQFWRKILNIPLPFMQFLSSWIFI